MMTMMTMVKVECEQNFVVRLLVGVLVGASARERVYLSCLDYMTVHKIADIRSSYTCRSRFRCALAAR